MKRRIALLTALFVLISALSAFAQGFSDMPPTDNKYHDAFKYAIEKKLISGDGTNLNPDSYITYAEALTIISRIKPFDCAETDITQFGVLKDKWYYSTVAKAYTAGYITIESDGKLYPEKNIQKLVAFPLVAKVYGKTVSPVADNSLCTRADFVWEIYFQAPDGYQASMQTPTEAAPTEAVSEVPTEFTDLRAQIAQEAMQLALGILPDGSSYTNIAVYKDTTQSDWASGKVSSSSSSSRPSRPSKPDDDDEDEEPTQAPTEDNDKPTEPETQPPTDAPTEPETQEPTYGEYDGPIDNDKDNVVDDPFDDGWRPPGWVGGDDDNDDSGNEGGWDAEDEDFNINDADDPDYQPETQPTEETQAPSDEETQAPSDEETQAPSDEETQAPSDEETQAPSDEETQAPSDEETQAPSDEETQAPTDEETQAPTDEETQAPSDEETQAPSDEATPPEEEAGDVTNGEDESNTETDDGTSTAFEWIFSKDWWFD